MHKRRRARHDTRRDPAVYAARAKKSQLVTRLVYQPLHTLERDFERRRLGLVCAKCGWRPTSEAAPHLSSSPRAPLLSSRGHEARLLAVRPHPPSPRPAHSLWSRVDCALCARALDAFSGRQWTSIGWQLSTRHELYHLAGRRSSRRLYDAGAPCPDRGPHAGPLLHVPPPPTLSWPDAHAIHRPSPPCHRPARELSPACVRLLPCRRAADGGRLRLRPRAASSLSEYYPPGFIAPLSPLAALGLFKPRRGGSAKWRRRLPRARSRACRVRSWVASCVVPRAPAFVHTHRTTRLYSADTAK